MSKFSNSDFLIEFIMNPVIKGERFAVHKYNTDLIFCWDDSLMIVKNATLYKIWKIHALNETKLFQCYLPDIIFWNKKH